MIMVIFMPLLFIDETKCTFLATVDFRLEILKTDYDQWINR